MATKQALKVWELSSGYTVKVVKSKSRLAAGGYRIGIYRPNGEFSFDIDNVLTLPSHASLTNAQLKALCLEEFKTIYTKDVVVALANIVAELRENCKELSIGLGR